ncbi:MAG: hypothetical protein ACR2OO_13275 [Thermomicrobiales bacterium]
MTPTETEDRSEAPRSRLESEILEILDRADTPPSNVVKFRANVRQSRWSLAHRLQTMRASSSSMPSSWLPASVLLAVAAWVIGRWSPLFGHLLGWAAVVAFAAVFISWYRQPKRRGPQRWRGQDIQYSAPLRRPGWLDRFFKGGPRL